MNVNGDPDEEFEDRSFLNEASFAITARIALQLGRESISNSVVAIIELVKNAYDADAENVWLHFIDLDAEDPDARCIVIEDDGTGMNEKQLENSWLVIGTDTKQVVSRSKGKARVLTGEKGLGRLGLDRLCTRTRVQTCVETTSHGLELDIDWTKYEGTQARLESIKHDLYRISNPISYANKGKKKRKVKGTILILSGLKDEWSLYDLGRLRSELALLVSPFRGLNDFNIHLDTGGKLDSDGPVTSDNLLDAAEWKVTSQLVDESEESEGKDGSKYVLELEMTSSRNQASFKIGPYLWSSVFRDRQVGPECGPVSFDFYYLPREDIKELSLTRGQVGRFMDNNQGIRIYRDGFRVQPYGKPTGEGDWLGLGLRRTRSPGPIRGRVGEWRAGYNQVIGAVFIERDRNAALLDQTNREGIVEGVPYYDLRRFALWSIENFEQQLQKYEKAQGRDKDDDVNKARVAIEETSKVSLAAIEEIKTRVQTAAELLTAPAGDASSNATEEMGHIVDMVEALSKTVSEQEDKREQFEQAVDRREEERQQEFQRQKDTLSNLASLGILATTFGHETLAASNLVLANTSELKSIVANLYWIAGDAMQQIQTSTDNIAYGAGKINTFATFTLRNVTRDKRMRTKVFLDTLVTRVFKSFSQALQEERKIALEFDFAEQIPPLTAFSIDWESIIINFITNAIWALEDTPDTERKIRVRISKSSSAVTLAFADSGCGLASGTEDSIFIPTFTTKRNKRGDLIGTGMGLAIVQNFVESYGGTIRVEPRSDLGGTQFIIEVPLKPIEKDQENASNG